MSFINFYPIAGAGCKLSIFVKIAAIISMALFQNNFTQGQLLAPNPITVTPLWNETLPCNFEERDINQGILHGNARYTCSIQVMPSVGYHTQLEIPNSHLSNESFSLYIERQGDLGICTNIV